MGCVRVACRYTLRSLIYRQNKRGPRTDTWLAFNFTICRWRWLRKNTLGDKSETIVALQWKIKEFVAFSWVISRQMYSRLQMGCSDLAQILHTYSLWQNMNFCQVSALNMLYGGFREISKFWQFCSIFLHEFFKIHVKHQKITQKNIQTYIIDVKFPAEHGVHAFHDKKRSRCCWTCISNAAKLIDRDLRCIIGYYFQIVGGLQRSMDKIHERIWKRYIYVIEQWES